MPKQNLVALIGLCFAVLFLSACSKPLVPKSFIPESEKVCKHFVFKAIDADRAAEDYRAVMQSRSIIHKALQSEKWPDADFTAADNERDLKTKEKAFASKAAFTYSILSPDEQEVWGALYINKGKKGADAAIYFWVRQDLYRLGYDAMVEQSVRDWINIDWPFRNPIFPGRDDRLTRFLQTLYPEDKPGAVIGIQKDSLAPYWFAGGLANTDEDLSLTTDMVFPIASMTKIYTATAIMMLVEAGKLQLDDSLPKWYPDLDETYGKVKVKHLLSHTSGIPSYNRISAYQSIADKEVLTLEQMCKLIDSDALNFEPGSRFRYSNSNYIYLTDIISRVSGMLYEDFISKRILEPLKLDETYFAAVKEQPQGYGLVGEEYVPMGENTHHTYGAGMLHATINDLLVFWQALNHGRLISNAHVAYLYSVPLLHNDGRPDEYGHGVWVTTFDGEQVIKLEGYCKGFHTQLFYYPGMDLTVAVMPNTSGFPMRVDPAYIARWVSRLVQDKPIEIFESVQLPDSLLEKYIGVYQINQENYLQVFLKDHQLYTLRTGGQMMEAKAHFVSGFYYPNSFTSFLFDDINEGFVVQVTDDEGNTSVATKAKMPLRKSITIDTSVFSHYVGTYEKGVKIFTKDKQLIFTNGFYSYQLYPKSENQFFPWHEDATFTFAANSLTYEIGTFSMTVKKLNE